MKMKKSTVRRRIFRSNALILLATIAMLMLVNIGIVKLYGESIEEEWKHSVESMISEDQVEEFVADWTVRQNSFIVLFIVDAIACIGVVALITYLFTKNLADHICRPLEELEEGARRMRENDLSTAVDYTGDAEFENVCDAFNGMQEHILEEQEKNRKYEKARTDMIAGISHDLKTPLTAIKGTIKALLDGVAKTEAQQTKFLETAYRRTGDMDVLLNQLFYVSRLETGNMPLNCQHLKANEFLKSYVHGKQGLLLEGESLEYRILELENKNLEDEICVDPEQLQRILDNLLENSRKYANATPLKIGIAEQWQGNRVKICFVDNGSGVDADKLPHLFEEFYRGDEARSQKEGNGLGLYIVKYLTEAMGGKVWAENTVAGGLAIYMEYPVSREQK